MVHQRGRGCSSKQRTCYGRQRRKVFAKWQEQESHRSSLKDSDFGEKEVIIYDQLALERHDYTATKAERIRYSLSEY